MYLHGHSKQQVNKMSYPATTFPTSLDNSTQNPLPIATSDTALFDHAGLHDFVNNAIFALENKVGINNSAVNTSFDYKLSGVATGDKAVSKTGTETLTNKTLTAPVVNSAQLLTIAKFTVGSDATGDIYYNGGSGVLTRLPIGTAGYYLTSSGSAPQWSSAASLATQGGVQNQTYTYAADTGSSTAYVVTMSPAVGAYQTGQSFVFKAANANTTTTPTLNVNSLGAKTITNPDGTALVVGQIAAGALIKVIYDGTYFQIQTQNTTGVKVKSGTLTINNNSASTTTTITCGFTPKAIRVWASSGAANSWGGSFGTWNATDGNSCAYILTNANTTSSTYIFYVNNTNNAYYIRGLVNNITSTGFDLVITSDNSSSITGALSYETIY